MPETRGIRGADMDEHVTPLANEPDSIKWPVPKGGNRKKKLQDGGCRVQPGHTAPCLLRASRENTMRLTDLLRTTGLLLGAALLAWGCAGPGPDRVGTAPGRQTRQSDGVLVGTVLARSDRDHTISIRTGTGTAGRDQEVAFDDTTRGMGFVGRGRGIVVVWEMQDGRPLAREIRPMLISLPAGVRGIGVDEVSQALAAGESPVLVDTRPGKRYSRSHLPGAISIPAGRRDALSGRLPRDRDRLLVFYGQGPT